jgi:hypothetical protein
MNFFAKIDSDNNILEYPVHEGIMAQRFPDIFPSNFDPSDPPHYDEHTPLPEGYVYIKKQQVFNPDWIEYNYEEETPVLKEDGFWYQNYVAYPRPEQMKQELLEYKAREERRKRDELLAKSDWIMISDSPIPEPIKQQWIVYRKALRDIPQQPEFPKIVNWPIMP